MADSAALRARRSRLHAKGNHSLCKPGGLCPDAPVAATGPSRETETRHAGRGERLWRDMDGGNLAPAQRVLLEEACRIADRLDQLDALLRGDVEVWARVQLPRGDDTELVLRVDAAMAEARQHATALKVILADLRAALAPPKPNGRPAPADVSVTPEKPRGSGGVLDLSARIRERLQSPAG